MLASQVSYGALAPGGCVQCGCCGSQNCAGDRAGITGLQFIDAMKAAVPDVFDYVDFLASHSYPASGGVHVRMAVVVCLCSPLANFAVPLPPP